MDHRNEFDEPYRFLHGWGDYVEKPFINGILEDLDPIETRQSSQSINIEQALAKCIISLDYCHSATHNDTVNISPKIFMLQFFIVFFLVPSSPEIDEFIARVQKSRCESAPSFSRVMIQVHDILNSLKQNSPKVQPLRVNGRQVSQPDEERTREQSHESVDFEEAEKLLESQLLQTGSDGGAEPSLTEDTRFTVNTPASATRPSLIGLPSIHGDSEGEDGEEDMIPLSWVASPALHKLLECQRNSLAKQIFGSPPRVFRLNEYFPDAEAELLADDELLAEMEQFHGVVTSPSPDPYAPYTAPDAVISNDDRLPGAEQSLETSSIPESNTSSPGPPKEPSPIFPSRRFIVSNSVSPSPPEKPPRTKKVHFEAPAPVSERILRSAQKSAAPLKHTGIKGKARRPPRKRNSAKSPLLRGIEGKAQRRPKTQKSVKPQPTQDVVMKVSVPPDEICRRKVRSSFRDWCPPIAGYITFAPPNEKNRKYRTFYAYEVPLLDKSTMTQIKIRNVEGKLRKLTDRFISTKAIRPDGSFVDSIFDMAKNPGRTMADVWERLLQQMNKTSEYTLVVKFLTFSVFIVNLSTLNPKYRAIYDGFSAADKKFVHLVNILQALCCRLDLRWAGRHLSLVGHLLKEVGLRVLEDVFIASQPVAFYKVLQQLNSVSMGPSGNGMTAVDYVKIYLRDAEDSSENIIMNALAQIPELPNEQLQPTKHGGDLHASWSKDHLDHLGFYVTEERQNQAKKRFYENVEGDEEQGAKRPRYADDSGYCEGDNSTGTDLSRDVELFAKQVENHRMMTQASDVRPFQVSCHGEDVLQLIANGRLKEDFANMIVGLLAHSAVDHTVYLGIHKYESMEDKEFGEVTSQVEHIHRVGRWFLVICHQMQYQSVRIDWEGSTISVFTPYYPFIIAGHSPPNVHVARQHQEVVYDRMEEWTQLLLDTPKEWARTRLDGPLQEVEDSENSLLFNIWGLREWLPGKEFDGVWGDSIKYKRMFLELIKSQTNWMKET